MDQASEIREKIDIASFISEYIPLKKAGRNFKANCPFHNENTPSFIVSPERQIWHCFGCGKGGDAFTFLMEYENLEFPEALRILAKKTGVTLKTSGFKQAEYSEKEKIFAINSFALKFYHYILTKHPAGKTALAYLLDKRKITKQAIETFEIGFSPNTGSALSDYLTKKKDYKNKDLLLAGVSVEKGARLYDFFKNRIMFPLFDHRSNVVGFSGRILEDNSTPVKSFDPELKIEGQVSSSFGSSAPKYINTKETSVYHKGNMFFGLNNAKEEIKQKQDAIIVEGELDVISLFENNIKNVVAIKGTALTESQVSLLSRFAPKVTLCLDQDSAGFEATKRSLEVLEKKGLTTDIIVLDKAKDPDEAIKEDPIAFKKALKEKQGIYDFMIDKFVSQNNKETAAGKKVITDNLLALFANISNEIIKEHYMKRLSKILDITYENLLKETEKHQQKEQEDKILIPQKNRKTEREIAEEFLMALIFQSKNPKKIVDDYKKFLKEYSFETQSLGKVLEILFKFFEISNKFDGKNFSSILPNELKTAFDICYLYPLSKYGLDESNEIKYIQEIEKKIERLNEFHKKDKITKKR
jgi:DNA primase